MLHLLHETCVLSFATGLPCILLLLESTTLPPLALEVMIPVL